MYDVLEGTVHLGAQTEACFLLCSLCVFITAIYACVLFKGFSSVEESGVEMEDFGR